MDAARALFNGVWEDPQIIVGVTVMSVLGVIALWVASRAFSRGNA